MQGDLGGWVFHDGPSYFHEVKMISPYELVNLGAIFACIAYVGQFTVARLMRSRRG